MLTRDMITTYYFLVPGNRAFVYEHQLLKDLLGVVILVKSIYSNFPMGAGCENSHTASSLENNHPLQPNIRRTQEDIFGDQISHPKDSQISLTISLIVALDSPFH